ncbi:MAG: SH3 domain-containing protein [Candidatus Riflebacteria bacterium]|nr:SH3 domain-containing protein [Candidatus Riflebacteria bacterium]
MSIKFVHLYFVFLILLFGFPFTGYSFDQDENVAVTAEKGLSMREKPDQGAKKIKTLPSKALVKIEKTGGNETEIDGLKAFWYKVKDASDSVGWVFGGYLGKIEDNEKKEGLITKSNERVSKKGKDLKISLLNGKEKAFSDISERDDCKKYELRDYFDFLGMYLICLNGNEWYHYILVNEKDGEEIVLKENPVFSPKKEYFFCSLLDNMNGSGFQIFKIEGKNAKNVYEIEVDDWNPENAKWDSETEISLTQHVLKNQENIPIKIVLDQSTQKWQLQK